MSVSLSEKNRDASTHPLLAPAGSQENNSGQRPRWRAARASTEIPCSEHLDPAECRAMGKKRRGHTQDAQRHASRDALQQQLDPADCRALGSLGWPCGQLCRGCGSRLRPALSRLHGCDQLCRGCAAGPSPRRSSGGAPCVPCVAAHHFRSMREERPPDQARPLRGRGWCAHHTQAWGMRTSQQQQRGPASQRSVRRSR